MGARRKALLIFLIFWIGVSQLVSSENSDVEAKNKKISPGPVASPPAGGPFPSTAKKDDTSKSNGTVSAGSGTSNDTVSKSLDGKENEAPEGSKNEHKDGEQTDHKKDEESRETEKKDEHCCGSKLRACLASPGDASDEVLSLLITSRNNVKVEIITPGFLSANPATFTTENGKDVTVRIEMVDAETAKQQTSSTIKIQSTADSCELPVPSKNLGYNEDKNGFNYSTLRTPVVGFGMLAAALVLVLGIWAYCRYRVKKTRHGETADGARYVELEMGLNHTGTVSQNSTGEVDDNWDQGWEDDWEDSGSSQFKLTKSLSAKGLAARRTAKDGWAD